MTMEDELSWCEVSSGALAHNARAFKARVGGARLGVVVKADAYGHGMELAARAFLAGGADWLVVNALHEAERLRAAGVEAPLHVVGYVPPGQARRAVAAGVRLVVYDAEVALAMAAAGREAGRVVPLHVKVETGNNRQGLERDEALALGRLIAGLEGVALEGVATHYADIEDTTDHRFAMAQVARFEDAVAAFRAAGLAVPVTSTANSAATILWPRTHGALVRVGIAAYGLWPSSETYVAAVTLPNEVGGRGGFLPELRPALTWRARVAQVKTVKAGGWIGYGRTYRCTHDTRIAIVPVGYHEGYDRRLSNVAHTLVAGVRAPVRGRVCMNMIMIDVSDIAGVAPGDVVTLMGEDATGGGARDGSPAAGDGARERVSAEDLARWCGTINYEVVSRIHPVIPRVAVD